MPQIIDLRKGAPSCVIFLWPKDGTLPNGFSHESRLFGKHIKTIATACTNPDSCVGTTHTELDNSTCHGHTTTISGAHCHTAPSPTPASPGPGTNVVRQFNQPTSPSAGYGPSHSHIMCLFNNPNPGIPLTITNTSNPHTHSVASSENPAHKTIRHVKYSNLNMRTKALPIDTTMLFGHNISCKPNCWIVNTCVMGNNFTKGVADACSTVLSSAGSNSHSHPTSSGHTHGLSTGSHPHTVNIRNLIEADKLLGSAGPFPTGAKHNASHPHPTTSTASCAATTPSTLSSNPTHSHGSTSTCPSYKEFAFLSKNNICMRKFGLPTKSIVEWLEPLACIPSCMLLADGTGCTISTINTWVKSTLTACTDPGTTGGGGTHAHGSAGAHTHASGSALHTHLITMGPSGANPTGAPDRGGISTSAPTTPYKDSVPTPVGAHTHSCPSTPTASTADGIPYTTTSSSGSHSHAGCVTYDPPALSVALIQRI